MRRRASLRFKVSIPRQLLLLLALSVGVTLITAIAYHFALQSSMLDSSAVTRSAVSRLTQSYDMLDRLSKSQGDL